MRTIHINHCFYPQTSQIVVPILLTMPYLVSYRISMRVDAREERAKSSRDKIEGTCSSSEGGEEPACWPWIWVTSMNMGREEDEINFAKTIDGRMSKENKTESA